MGDDQSMSGGAIGAGLTDDELDAVHSCLYDEVYYGDDSVVHGEDLYARSLRSALAKVENEAKKRKFWWAS